MDWSHQGYPAGKCVRPILFTIYINDLPDALENKIKLFADDTKVFASVNNEEDKNSLQGDIDKLLNWSDTWLLKYKNQNVNICIWDQKQTTITWWRKIW
jgi:hypothetical protein